MSIWVLANFLHDTFWEEDIDYPLQSTWIDNIICGEDDDLYAAFLLFMLACANCVCNAALWSLKKFVNSPLFNINYIRVRTIWSNSTFGYGKQECNWYYKNVPAKIENTSTNMHGQFPCTIKTCALWWCQNQDCLPCIVFCIWAQWCNSCWFSCDQCAIAIKWVPVLLQVIGCCLYGFAAMDNSLFLATQYNGIGFNAPHVHLFQ